MTQSHNDTKYNATQQNDIQCYDTKHNDAKHNDIQCNDIQFYDTKQDATQRNVILLIVIIQSVI